MSMCYPIIRNGCGVLWDIDLIIHHGVNTKLTFEDKKRFKFISYIYEMPSHPMGIYDLYPLGPYKCLQAIFFFILHT